MWLFYYNNIWLYALLYFAFCNEDIPLYYNPTQACILVLYNNKCTRVPKSAREQRGGG